MDGCLASFPGYAHAISAWTHLGSDGRVAGTATRSVCGNWKLRAMTTVLSCAVCRLKLHEKTPCAQ
eukprot:5611756-Amphidinium_carterae.1